MEPPNVRSQATTSQSWVIFWLGSQVYGLPVAPIEQIVPMVTIIPLPEIGEPVAGVINVQGTAVPVVDLRQHVGLAEANLLLDTPIVLARIGAHTLGLVVDEVEDVLSLAPANLIDPGTILPPELGEVPVVAALARRSEHLILLLDPDHLFRPEQAEALARAAELLPQLAAQTAEPDRGPKANE